jgi:Uncharacterised protein family UPF0547
MNPVQSVQTAIQNGWQRVLEGINALNPIPEQLRPLLGSRYFWFALWIAVFASIGRNLLGSRLGALIGTALGAALWWSFVPNAELEIMLLIAAALVLPWFGAWLTRTGLGRRARGQRVCPDCAEEVKFEAKVCKHCGYRFEAQVKGSKG